MSELRRLLIDKKRLRLSFSLDGLISLKREEEHYLRNVIRLNKGNLIAVVDVSIPTIDVAGVSIISNDGGFISNIKLKRI